MRRAHLQVGTEGFNQGRSVFSHRRAERLSGGGVHQVTLCPLGGIGYLSRVTKIETRIKRNKRGVEFICQGWKELMKEGAFGVLVMPVVLVWVVIN